MSDLGRYRDGDTLHFERVLAGPPDLVWEYLTNSEALPEWLGAGEITPGVGGKVMLRSGGPIVRGKVLEWQPQQRLAYSWIPYMPMADEPAAPESVVTFTLAPQNEGTLLT